jgi:sugar lactone lactonase YvrE
MRLPVCFILLSTVLTSGVFAADLKYPLSAATTPDGTLYIADLRLPGVWKVAGGKPEIYFQASKKFRTPLNAVRCLAVDSKGRLLAGDSATREVYRFDKDGKPVPLTKGGIGIPMAIAPDGKGTLYVSDLETQRIWKVPEEGVPEKGGKPEEFAVIAGVRGLAFDKDSKLYAVNAGKDGLVRFTPDGKKETVAVGRVFRFGHNVAIGKDGTAYVADGYGKCLWKIAPGKKPEKLVEGGEFVNPVGLSWHKGNLLLVDSRANAVFEVTTAGKVKKLIAGPPAKK